MLGAVHLGRIAAHAVGIGEIAGGGVEAHRLRAHAGAGEVEDLEAGHGVLPYEVVY
jgi:hypothetical protein